MTRPQRPVHVVGVGMIPFTKPGQSDPYTVMGARAAKLALEDAGVPYARVAAGLRRLRLRRLHRRPGAIYGVGLTGIPVFNLNNKLLQRLSALYLARQAVESGMVECAIALGFEQMVPGALKGAYDDRPSPMARFAETMTELQGFDDAAPRASQFFGGAGRDYMKEYGIRADTFARISVKARQHAARNPLAVFRDTVTLDQVMAAPTVFEPLTRLQCCPPTCGAAAPSCARKTSRAATAWMPRSSSPRRP
jgi:acetyl-CoA acetyltransferase